MRQKSGAFTAHQHETAHESANTIRQTQQPVSVESIITVERLVKSYKRATTNAVNDISFRVAPGTLFALLGPNGAGKTTTISILTTTLLPTSGTVTIAGYDVAKQAAAVRDNVGIIFQKPSLDLNLTAEENVRFHAALYGLYAFRPAYALMPREYKRHVHEFATLLDIDEDLFTPVKKYSGGMKRKLEILRSLLHRPKVLFLDEPTSGLDPISRHSLWEYLYRVRIESGTTIFLTTHYLEEAEQANSICVMNKGNIVSSGTPLQIKSELSEEYLLIDAEDRARLRAELVQLNLSYTETPLFKLPLVGPQIHRTLKAITTPLTVVETHRPTLEDAYLEIVGEQQ